ncbi:hypothetical protein FGO68_gene5303 [Halteria grandinella]|uniref:Uncharacterized protein n=1 Tax=Halteria grandinella TaxID=5974 RepID=A0A8J8N9M5_HALGN|nr:hypothetical protein FGO68_gene5303 [Halteria grandinella]
MKCRTRIDDNSVADFEAAMLMDAPEGEDPLGANKDMMIKEFLRKNMLKFYINIYKDTSQEGVQGRSTRGNQSNGGNFNSSLSGSHALDEQYKYMLDIHLFKGTVYVFMEFVSHFMQIVTSSCSVCSHNNSCCSSQHSSSQHAPSHLHDYKLKLYTQ